MAHRQELVGPPLSRAGSNQPAAVAPAPAVPPEAEAQGPSGLERFAGRLGRASVSFLTQTPQIELDRQEAAVALIETQAEGQRQEVESARVAAEEQLAVQNLSRIAFDPAGGPEADAALAEIFARDPVQADRLLEGLGATSQAKREEAGRDAAAIRALPAEQRRPAILERAARIEAQGRDASQTLSLLGMDPETQDNQLRTVEAAALSSAERGTAERAEATAARAERTTRVAERGIELREDELTAARGLAESARVTKQTEADLKTEGGLRKEVNTLLKDFFLVADANARIKAAGTNPSAAGDLALIFNYMKLLDPGSTVREGEFANAQNSASVPQRVRGLYNSITAGQRLSEGQRTDFLDRAESLFGAAVDEATKTANSFERIATTAGVNVNNVLATFQERAGAVPPAAGTSNVGRFTVETVP